MPHTGQVWNIMTGSDRMLGIAGEGHGLVGNGA
jgi:hypothetical protein